MAATIQQATYPMQQTVSGLLLEYYQSRVLLPFTVIHDRILVVSITAVPGV
jgi:hypothetical protein